MSMKVNKYITPCWPGLLPRSRSPSHRRLSEQIISPATGAAREPSASLPQRSDHGPPPQVQFDLYGDQALLLFDH
jgi:hypothetical protein